MISSLKSNETSADSLKSDNQSPQSLLTLKDGDFRNLGVKIFLSQSDSEKLKDIIISNTELLKSYRLTDYSFLVSVHKYIKEDFEKLKNNCRVMKSDDNQYLYNFSIIDFLTVKKLYINFQEYDYVKLGEIIFKNIKNYVKRAKDFNISAMEHEGYAIRFRNFIYDSIHVNEN
jgi:hypothetical protein